MRPALLIALLLSAPAWAEPPEPIKVTSGYVTDRKGLDHTVGAGLYMTAETSIALAARLAAAEAEVVSLKAAPAPPPPLGAADVAVLGVIITVVAAGAFALGRLSR